MSARDEFKRAKVLFISACELPQDERSQFLDDACAGDRMLRSRVDELRGAEKDSVLESPVIRNPDAERPDPEEIDGYRLVK